MADFSVLSEGNYIVVRPINSSQAYYHRKESASFNVSPTFFSISSELHSHSMAYSAIQETNNGTLSISDFIASLEVSTNGDTDSGGGSNQVTSGTFTPSLDDGLVKNYFFGGELGGFPALILGDLTITYDDDNGDSKNVIIAVDNEEPEDFGELINLLNNGQDVFTFSEPIDSKDYPIGIENVFVVTRGAGTGAADPKNITFIDPFDTGGGASIDNSISFVNQSNNPFYVSSEHNVTVEGLGTVYELINSVSNFTGEIGAIVTIESGQIRANYDVNNRPDWSAPRGRLFSTGESFSIGKTPVSEKGDSSEIMRFSAIANDGLESKIYVQFFKPKSDK